MAIVQHQERMKRMFVLVLYLFAGCNSEQRDASPAKPAEKEQSQKEQLFSPKEEAKFKLVSAESACEMWHGTAEMWKTVKGRYPTSFEDLKKPLMPDVPPPPVYDDPWGNAYVYEVKGGKVRVSSFGPDGKQGTPDDITYPPK